jgi:hypothetical protein
VVVSKKPSPPISWHRSSSKAATVPGEPTNSPTLVWPEGQFPEGSTRSEHPIEHAPMPIGRQIARQGLIEIKFREVDQADARQHAQVLFQCKVALLLDSFRVGFCVGFPEHWLDEVQHLHVIGIAPILRSLRPDISRYFAAAAINAVAMDLWTSKPPRNSASATFTEKVSPESKRCPSLRN